MEPPAAATPVSAPAIQSAALPSRANYNYSVIPGGARSAQELAHAIETDSVVADHYRDLDPSTMHPQKVAADRMAYVSYRKNERVFWTKKKVRIYEGETILTNGETEVRGRCGNAISMEPLLPTSDDEPEETEFDALTDVGPLLVSFNLTPAGIPLVAAPAADGAIGAPGIGPLGFGIGGVASGASADDPGDGFPGFPPSAFDPEIGCGGQAGVGAAVARAGAPSGAFAEDVQAEADPCAIELPGPELFGLDPLVLQPLLDSDPGPDPNPNPDPDPPNPTRFRETPPVNPTPVPEPTTLLLFGSGIAGLLARHRRAKNR